MAYRMNKRMGEIGNKIRVNTAPAGAKRGTASLAAPSRGLITGTTRAMSVGRGKKKGLFKKMGM